jgi:hypothetical protein
VISQCSIRTLDNFITHDLKVHQQAQISPQKPSI